MTRIPRQQRSRATVDALIEAAFLAVAQHGTAVTTRHIAERAGTSVGTLYEYFADKEALFAAMQQRFIADVLVLIETLRPQLVGASVGAVTRTLLLGFEELLLRQDQRYLHAARALMHPDAMSQAMPIKAVLRQFVQEDLASRPEYAHLQGVPAMSYVMIEGGIHLLLDHLAQPNPEISFHALTDALVGIVTRFVDAG